ncbi:hypothetical protein C2I17_00950 [Niallia circulans]|nr:hypothetical protein C2I17_00950 [Niallia circulans]
MQLKKIDIDMIAHSLLTSLITAICICTIYLINSSYFSLLGILIFSFIFFCFYLVIASPLQILLNQRPKKFSILYLAIYNVFSGVVTWIVAMFFDMEDPFHSSIFYFVCISFLES